MVLVLSSDVKVLVFVSRLNVKVFVLNSSSLVRCRWRDAAEENLTLLLFRYFPALQDYLDMQFYFYDC